MYYFSHSPKKLVFLHISKLIFKINISHFREIVNTPLHYITVIKSILKNVLGYNLFKYQIISLIKLSLI